ncbi:MAG: hypothetical protein U9Q06_02295 [Nanoarchaeota archaeon]|nr:hypothetical protein [Nanoarchaeota archaeon]
MARDEGLNEITLRKYERPYSMGKRQLVKKICLSLGLLQPGDSRDSIVDILLVLINAQKEKEKLDSVEIGKRVEIIRKENNLEMKGLAESNIRRQLKRLKDLMIIDKQANFYNLSEFESLEQIFDEKIQKFIIEPSIARIKEYLEELNK